MSATCENNGHLFAGKINCIMCGAENNTQQSPQDCGDKAQTLTVEELTAAFEDYDRATSYPLGARDYAFYLSQCFPKLIISKAKGE